MDLLRQGKDGRFVRIEGMPDDALIVGMTEHARFDYNEIVLKIWSATFPEVPDGRCLEYFDLQCSLYQEPAKKPLGREFI